MTENDLKNQMANCATVYGELHQDAFALATSAFKRNGYFVEFGVMGGKEYSNTYQLEKQYNWNGIVSEPNPRFHAELFEHRSCVIDNRAVFDVTGQTLEFLCAHHGYSAIKEFSSHNGDTIQVESISLVDLLDEHNAPGYIDFVSIDTEGSELKILQAFDFDKYKVGAWTIEHNFTNTRSPIHDLMAANGYTRVLSDISHYDDWYIRSSLIS